MQVRFGPIRGIKEVQDFLKNAPRGAVKPALIAIVEYFIGNERHGLKHDDPYKQTTRAAVYGRQWESDKQRRYVMAMIREGKIVLGKRSRNPTDASKGYGYQETKSGYGATITNDQPGAYWTRKWGGWKNWRLYMEVIQANMKGALKEGMKVFNQYIKR
jgi:hypothetical protein